MSFRMIHRSRTSCRISFAVAAIIALCVGHDLMVVTSRQHAIETLVKYTTAFAVAPTPWRQEATRHAIVARINGLIPIIRDTREFNFLTIDSRSTIQFNDTNDQFTYKISTPAPAFLLSQIGLVPGTLIASSTRKLRLRSKFVVAQTKP